MGNKSISQIVGINNIYVQTKVSCIITLKNVRHVPDLRLNLLSTSTLDKEGYEYFMGKGIWKLTKGSLVVARGKMFCSLYKTHLKIYGNQLNVIENDASSNLWHKQMVYMSKKGLQLLAKQSLIPMAKNGILNPYEQCLFGKHHCVSL